MLKSSDRYIPTPPKFPDVSPRGTKGSAQFRPPEPQRMAEVAQWLGHGVILDWVRLRGRLYIADSLDVGMQARCAAPGKKRVMNGLVDGMVVGFGKSRCMSKIVFATRHRRPGPDMDSRLDVGLLLLLTIGTLGLAELFKVREADVAV